MSTNSFEALEPSIRKAKFILPNERIYTLDFDHNIQMSELKIMIQKAAHLKYKNFRLFSNGEEYTQYNSEIFSSIFPTQNLVVFTLELGPDEEYSDQNELILQMNSPCNIHSDKFLMYYCFTCNTSICSDCFTVGSHKNHKIQDKCFYLLPSKYLVEKIFENWSQKPYEEFQISVDLSDLKNKVNSVMFQELFNMLRKVQEKCNLLIDEYNQVNTTSLNNIRNSVRDIKLSCIKALDGLKGDLNIQNIVNNQDIFIQFDKEYKDLGKEQNEKFKKNLENFGELNKKVSILVENLIRQIYSVIYKTLNDMLEESQFQNVKKQINMKLIKPHEEKEIINRMSEHKKKRNSLSNINNINSTNFAKAIAKSVQNKLNSDPSKGKNLNINQNMKQINPFINQEIEVDKNQNNKTTVNNINKNIVTFGYNNNTIIPNNLPNSVGQIHFGVRQEQKNDLPQNKMNNTKNESESQFSSAQISRQNLTTNIIPKINISNSNLFSSSQNNNDKIQFNNNNQLNSSISNNLNNTSNDNITSSQISNINVINQTQPPIYKAIETKTITTTTTIPNIISNNKYNNDNGIINQHQHQHQHNVITFSISENANSSSDNNNYETIKYIQQVQRMNNNNNIQEDISESENEIHHNTNIKRYLDRNYILSPVPQTNSIKIMTENNSEESTIPVKFPENFGFNSFFLDCAHCNCDLNKCLYVSGGIESTSEQNRSNVLLCIDINNNNELKVKKLANMNFARCGHTMISEGKYIYVLGGEDMNSVERYDIENDIWENLPSMISKRMYPILHINNGYLYAFFGKFKNGEYPCSIERLNISNKNENVKPDWEMIMFSNTENVDLRIYGCGVIEYLGMLYFFSGKVDEKTCDTIFYYNFEKRIIQREDSKTLWKDYFRENKFYHIGERDVQCSASKYFGVYITIQDQE